MKISLLHTTSLRKRSDARHRNVGGEGVVVRQSAGEVLVVSDVGARVLDLIDSENTIGGILSALSAEYDVAPEVLERDVLAYLQDLLDAEIIEPVAA